jgi:hypothetical protein
VVESALLEEGFDGEAVFQRGGAGIAERVASMRELSCRKFF